MKWKKLALLLLSIAGLLLLSVLAWGGSDDDDDEEEEEEEYTGVINADLAHTDENPFCDDDSCSCHEDPGEIENVKQYIEDSEMTTDEATQYYYGKNI
jgi:hypothetical protein